MSIIRRTLNPQGWTSVPNAALEDERLSYRARGILAYLLSRPDGWVTDSLRMAQKGKEGRDAVRSALRELEAVGYVHRRQVQGQRGLWATERYVYDRPVTSIEAAENPTLWPVDNSAETWGQPTPENPSPTPEKPTPENPALLTTNQNNLKKEHGEPTKSPSAPPPEWTLRARLIRALRAPVDLADARTLLSTAEVLASHSGVSVTEETDRLVELFTNDHAAFTRFIDAKRLVPLSGSASEEKAQAAPGLPDSLATLDRAAPRPSMDESERADF